MDVLAERIVKQTLITCQFLHTVLPITTYNSKEEVTFDNSSQVERFKTSHKATSKYALGEGHWFTGI